MKLISTIRHCSVKKLPRVYLKLQFTVLLLVVVQIHAITNTSAIYSYLYLVESTSEINEFSQQNSISGTAKDSNGEPLIGVNIIIEGTSNGTTTDFDGNFELNNIDGANITLVVSYTGYSTIRQVVDFTTTNSHVLNMVLKEEIMSLDEVVLTGTANPRKKIESSVAITTMNAVQMEQRVARNNADLLKAVPGLWVESTGGDGPANVWVRGFPQAGGYGFVGLMEDGLPVFQSGYNSMPSPDQFYKTDLTLKNVEAIRGGTAPIVMQGASGAVINNIS
ncbi:carboxypeptidase-like regulatory domain-containing protein [Tamlana sp. 2201CG12-4]|uniref:Plug domain-containing protein n=1 Tax=Tamlana sp. 2201CG12-4 TaxID=3112582 RepID=UPI002DBF6EE2|nr:carboxypeptidase-like regulatory domain-containing protein [Tamlana sp. 2201CG12-4]MEC3907538.1 carboxypeptidase-like regulatory domain-containing protein [Tamlana sp. 2201CG12-4]